MPSPSLPTPTTSRSTLPIGLTAPGAITLHDHLRHLTAQRDTVTLDDCVDSLHATFPSLRNVAGRKQASRALRKLGFSRWRTAKGFVYRRELQEPASAAPPLHPQHLNSTFRDWLRQRTELPRSAAGWTPLSVLHADYVAWCAANDAPDAYVHGEAAFSGMLRAHHDREPEQRLVQKRGLYETVKSTAYELCFPRHLLAPIRVFGS